MTTDVCCFSYTELPTISRCNPSVQLNKIQFRSLIVLVILYNRGEMTGGGGGGYDLGGKYHWGNVRVGGVGDRVGG